MSNLFLRAGIALFVAAGSLWAQPQQPPQQAAPASAIEQQKQAIERQREAVRKQSGAAEAHSFFTTGALSPAVTTPSGAAGTASAECEALPDQQVDKLIQESADKNKIEVKLVRAVMRQESAFKPCAVSPKGAQGLMQLMPATAQQFGVSDPFDPAQNVAAGTELLKQLLGRYNGDTKLALSAYNAGTAIVDKLKAVPDIPETQAYVANIISQIQ